MGPSAGLRSLAVEFPSVKRTNAYYARHQPEILASASERQLARMWAKAETSSGPDGVDAFDAEMAPYLEDLFRGTVERRVLAPGEKVIDVEKRAAKSALAAANLRPTEVDLLISSAFVPDHVGIGHAAFLSKDLGLSRAACFNLETACTSATEALRTASAFVRAGEVRNVLVVASCMYSKVSDDRDTLTWFLGDGAAAFVVGEVPAGQGVLGSKFIHTGETCGSIYYELSNEQGTPPICVRNDKASGKVLRESSARFLKECTSGALENAKVRLEDVGFFVFNTPTAWYAAFGARALGVSPDRTISTYPEYANTGPVLMPTNLHRAARTGRIRPGDLVLAYSIGSVSSAGAVVMRWGDVALGPDPAPARIID